MTIDQGFIDRAKRTDLAALVKSRGIVLKKRGQSLFGLCPFHADKNPSLSVNPRKNLFQCFGCGAAGDAIRFVELFDRVDFKEAVARLDACGLKAASAKADPATADPVLSVADQKLLSRVLAHYQHTLSQDGRGLAYLQKERGITDLQAIRDFGAGYVNGTLLEILPDDGQVLAALKRIGILNAKGHEFFYNCVVFPLFNGTSGGIESLYGRSIEDHAGPGAAHLYLPGPRRGIVNRQAVNRSQTLLLTESVIDALTLYDQGFKNVIPVYGVNGLSDDHLKLMAGRVKSAYLIFDADEAGKRGAESAAQRLGEKGIAACAVTLPVKDVNIYFKRCAPEQFEALLKAADPQALECSEKIRNRQQTVYKETENGFVAAFGARCYEIKAICRADTQLKAVVKASTDLSGKQPFELSTIDLYSARSRSWFAGLCADLFKAAVELVREDMGRLLELAEKFKPRPDKSAPVTLSAAEKESALTFLKNPDLFDEILSDLQTLGVVGENTNKLICYLTASSRKLEKPLSVLIQSRSSAGKSTLQNAVLSLMPEEAYERYTRVTDQALFYKKEDALVHKILAIEEDAGAAGAAYSIRNIQSAGRITVAATGKNPGTGRMETEDYTVRGPVAVMLTTTAPQTEQETASRFMVLTIDESAQMTAAIHARQRKARSLDGLVQKTRGAAVIKKHQAAQRLLKPLAVVNNFDQYLTYPSANLVTRRDHDKYLGLIEAVAFLHQYQRKIKTVNVDGRAVEYIEVSLEDIGRANDLADEVLGRSLDELPGPSATLLAAICRMVEQIAAEKGAPVEDVYFNRRQIREFIGWSDWQVKAHIRQLEELEYLRVRVGAQGKQYSYALAAGLRGGEKQRFYLNLTSVEEIKKRMARQADGDLEGDLPH